MPRFACSYAYDVPHYFDFTVEAKDEKEAEEKINKALDDGVFALVTCDACYNNENNNRVFVSGEARAMEEGRDETLEDLEQRAKELTSENVSATV